MWDVHSRGRKRGQSWLVTRCSLTVGQISNQKGLEKIVLERKEESMRSSPIGQWVAESLGGGIDSRKEIDL